MSVVVSERYEAEATNTRHGSRFYESDGARGDGREGMRAALRELMSLEVSLA